MGAADSPEAMALPQLLASARTAVAATWQAVVNGDLAALEEVADRSDLLAARLVAVAATLEAGQSPGDPGADGAAMLLALAGVSGRTRLLLHQCRLAANEELEYVLRLLMATPGYQASGAVPPAASAGRQIDQRV